VGELESAIQKHYRTDVILPIYMYDHSGITISTKPFSCPWDSGQVGFIVVDRNNMKKTMGYSRITEKRKKALLTRLETEVKMYDDYLCGEVCGYNIEGPEIDDSCLGFYSSEEALTEAKNVIDYACGQN
jgi:rubrerythrin